MLIKSFTAAALMAAVFGCAALPAAAEPEEAPAAEVFTAAERSAVEQIVHDYLINHPEVMYEVMAKLEQDQQNQFAKLLEDTAAELRFDPLTPMRGDPKAEHYLIEFFDYNCGYCKVVRQLTEKLAAEHNMHAVYIEFPILSRESMQAALAGLALYQMDKEKYFAYQQDLMTKGTRVSSSADIKAAVERTGASWEAVQRGAESVPIQNRLRANLDLGRRLGVTGTPFFIIDGRVLRGAVNDYNALESLLAKDDAAAAADGGK